MSQRQDALAAAVNALRSAQDGQFQAAIPVLEVVDGAITNWDDFRLAMLNDDYASVQSSFMNSLVQMIGRQILRIKALQNPLDVFRKEAMPFGGDLQVIFTNPASDDGVTKPVTDAKLATLLEVKKPDTKAVYMRENRGARYAVTIDERSFRRAMQTANDFGNYLDALWGSLENGNAWDSFLIVKGMLAGAVENNQIVIHPVQGDVTTEAGLKTLARAIRSDVMGMQIPSKQYNPYVKFEGSMGNPVITQSQVSDLVLILPTEIQAGLDVELYAYMFNLEKGQNPVTVLPTDNLGYEGCHAVLCDRNFVHIHEIDYRFANFFNAAALATNGYLHVNEIIDLEPWANAVAYVDSTNLPSIAATGIETDVAAVQGKTGRINYRTLPANATSEVTVTGDDGNTTVVVNQNTREIGFVAADPTVGAKLTITANGHDVSVLVNGGA